MKNLTALLQFIQEEHEQIHSVSFKHYILNYVRCDITFIGTLDPDTVHLINSFIDEYGAKLHPNFSDTIAKIYVIVEFNK